MTAWRPPRREPDGTQHRDVAHAAQYSIVTPLYRRAIAGGVVVCELLRSPTPAKRLVRLTAEYSDAGIATTHVVMCESEVDEVAQLQRLERIIGEASRRPSLTAAERRRQSRLRRAAAIARASFRVS